MKAKKIFDISGTILLFIGFFLALLPHAFHAAAGLGEESHTSHIITGITLILLGLGVLIWNSKR